MRDHGELRRQLVPIQERPLTGGEGESEGGEAVVQTAQQVMETYIGVYANFAYAIAGVGVLVILLNKPFNKLMHGVK